jgi:sugar (glycoside-pentoside-hexuronide) transporter
LSKSDFAGEATPPLRTATGRVPTLTGSTRLEDTKIKLSPWRKLAYALADGGNNFSYSFIISFLLFFATDVFGVGAAVIAAIILVARVVDAVLDPIIGGLADRTRTRWGSYRPWILFGSIPLCILLVLCFSAIPFESEVAKTIYLCVVFMLAMIVYSCVNIPYSAATAVITRDADERASVTSYRLVVAVAIGTFIIGQVTLPLVEFFSGPEGDAARGWFLTALVYAVVAMALYIVSFLNIKEVLAPQEEKQTFREMFRAMRGNGPAWILSFGFLVVGLFYYGRSSAYIYYFTYVAGDQALYTSFMLFFAIGSLAGAAFVPIIGPKLKNKAHLVVAGFLIAGVLMVVCDFMNPTDNWPLFVGINVVIAFCIIAAMTMMYGMVPDTTEYGEWKTGTRAAGFISAFITFALKVGMAIGISSIGFLLAGMGYQAGQAQSSETLSSINMLTNLLPGVGAIVGAIVFMFYRLNRKKYNEILDQVSGGND